MANLADSDVHDNQVLYDAGSASTANAMQINRSFRSSFRNNRLTNSPGIGILCQSSHDCDITGGHVVNANQNGTGASGITLTNAFNITVESVEIKDDTGASKLTTGINTTGTGNGHRARFNTIINATATTPIQTITGVYSDVRGNSLPSGAKIATNIAESYPGSTSAFTNPHPYPIQLFVSGGTITVIQIATVAGGLAFNTTGLTQGMFLLQPGDQIKCTSSGNPTTFESQAA